MKDWTTKKPLLWVYQLVRLYYPTFVVAVTTTVFCFWLWTITHNI